MITLDKYDYIESIILFINGITGINYQLKLKEVFKIYYESQGKTYEMPDYYGGDQKNDGWVVEDALFYQIYAPTRLKESLKKEIQKKFKTDLEGLIKIVYKDAKWNGRIEKFIFIVNTFDCELPHDSERYFETTVQELKAKFTIDFKYSVVNNEYIRDLLNTIDDIELLKRLSSVLHIKNLIDYNAITETIIIDIISEISGNIHSKIVFDDELTTYNRISSIKKIEINDLNDRRDEIESIITKLDVVEKAVKSINQDILFANKFERVKNFIIKKYAELSIELSGIKLYDTIIDETLSYTNSKSAVLIPMKFLIVYIFDKCDIFEKE
ncbi:hypothetical protein LL127_19100 [Clostridium estertheticum]|uniref:hypothetical protein n=1 Tax=Clostridium estertheticum TaxID=238834 RepID=UPI001CF17DA2|nr:hypothetical protein [Clostridium estertheticum]MCB2305601.1 hypothetical protein [Clostridium estertheticum]MCB2344583.1 hypothetical protein [Clostridium estertheticum]WAG45601.1 hypothetical protein LL127_19100 [Clostridium estertheticum]